MKTSEMLKAIANWLEDPDNEAFQLAEDNEHVLSVVAEACATAADILKNAAAKTDILEPNIVTEESLERLVNLANKLDQSSDPELRKEASVLDELLLTIAAPEDTIENIKRSEEEKIEFLKNRSEMLKKDLFF